MNKFDCILLCAGSSNRFNNNKVLINLINKPLFMWSLDEVLKSKYLNKVYLVISSNDRSYFNNLVFPENVIIVEGGSERYISLKNALKLVEEDICIIHDAARPLVRLSDFEGIFKERNNYNGISYYSKCVNTLRDIEGNTINRDKVLEIETPQLIKKEYYELFLNNNTLITDEIGLLENYNVSNIGYLETSHNNIKVTYPEDYIYVSNVLNESDYLIGHSYDVHKYTIGNKIILGGVNIPYEYGILAHSDGDVYIHALTEAIFGALADGDLGDHYPDSEAKYKEYNSTLFLKDALKLMNERGYIIDNIDSLIYLEEPKLSKYKKDIVLNISHLLNIPLYKVSVKATTLEKLALTGTSNGLAVEVVVLLKKIH